MPMEPASVSSDLISQLAAMPLAERLLLIAGRRRGGGRPTPDRARTAFTLDPAVG
jgi:hypothetical protein